MGKPRPQRPHVQRPSPLQQVHSTRPLSQVPDPAAAPPAASLVRDPHFWKRFSVAVHMAEVPGDEEKGSQRSRGNSVETKDEWLAQQHKEKRRCRVMCASITSVVILVIVAAAVVGWYFTKVRKI